MNKGISLLAMAALAAAGGELAGEGRTLPVVKGMGKNHRMAARKKRKAKLSKLSRKLNMRKRRGIS